MNEITKLILLALGLTQVQIDEMSKETPTIKQEDLMASISEHQKKLLKNDSEFIGEIKKAEKGRVLSLNEQVIRKTFGLTAEEVKDKTFDEIVTLGHQKAVTKSGATTEQLQQELVAANTKLKNYEEVEIPKIRGEVDLKKKNIDIRAKAVSELSGFEFTSAPDYAHKVLFVDVDAEYDLDENEKGELIPKLKATGLQPKSPDGTKLLTFKDIANEKFEKAGILKKSNAKPGDVKPGIVIKTGDDGTVKVKSEGANKAQAHLDEMTKGKKE